MRPSTARQVVIFSCLALAALTVRPMWVAFRLIRAPAMIQAERFDGIVGDGPPGVEELRRAERELLGAVGPDYTQAQLAAAIRSNRMIDRAAHEGWQERQARRLDIAGKRRVVGFVVIGTCVAVLLLWAVGGMLFIRNASRAR